MEQSQNYMSVLINALEKKSDALQTILSLTKEQEVLSKADSYPEEDMERILNAKEVQISRIESLDEGFQSIFDRVKAEVKSNTDKYKEEVIKLQELIRECTELGNEIMVLEQRNRERFSILFSKFNSQYSISKTKASVAQNYFRTMNNSKILDPYFVDKKQ